MEAEIDMFKSFTMFIFHYMFYVKTSEKKKINFLED